MRFLINDKTPEIPTCSCFTSTTALFERRTIYRRTQWKTSDVLSEWHAVLEFFFKFKMTEKVVLDLLWIRTFGPDALWFRAVRLRFELLELRVMTLRFVHRHIIVSNLLTSRINLESMVQGSNVEVKLPYIKLVDSFQAKVRSDPVGFEKMPRILFRPGFNLTLLATRRKKK